MCVYINYVPRVMLYSMLQAPQAQHSHALGVDMSHKSKAARLFATINSQYRNFTGIKPSVFGYFAVLAMFFTGQLETAGILWHRTMRNQRISGGNRCFFCCVVVTATNASVYARCLMRFRGERSSLRWLIAALSGIVLEQVCTQE